MLVYPPTQMHRVYNLNTGKKHQTEFFLHVFKLHQGCVTFMSIIKTVHKVEW